MQSHLAQLRGAGKGLIRARVPASGLLRCFIHPRFASATMPIRRDRGRGGSVRAEENPTCAANWVLLSPWPAPRPSSRFAHHSHDSRRAIRPDVLHRGLQLGHVRHREMGRYPPTKVDRRHKLGKCRMVQTRVNTSRMRSVSLFLIVQLMPCVRTSG